MRTGRSAYAPWLVWGLVWGCSPEKKGAEDSGSSTEQAGGDAAGGSGAGGGDGTGGGTGMGEDTGEDSGGDTAESPVEPWAFLVGELGNQVVRGVAVSGGEEVLFGGYFETGLDLGGEPYSSQGRDDLFVGATTPDGTHGWDLAAGASGTDAVSDVAVAPDGSIYVTGWFENEVDFGVQTLSAKGDYDGFVMRLSSAGEVEWVIQLGGRGDDRMRAVSADAEGVCVAGFTTNGITGVGVPLSSGSLLDGVVVCLDVAGNAVWGAAVGFASGTAPALSVDIGPDGVAAGGYFTGEVDLGAGRLASEGGRDGWVVRWSRLGADAVGVTLGSTGDQTVEGVVLGDAGEVHVVGSWAGGPLAGAGEPAGPSDAFVASLGGTLSLSGAQLMGGEGDDAALDVDFDPERGLAVVGWSDADLTLHDVHENRGEEDAWVAVRNGSDWVASESWGGPAEDIAHSVIWHAGGGLVVGGSSFGDIDLGTGVLSGAGDRDAFVARRLHPFP